MKIGEETKDLLSGLSWALKNHIETPSLWLSLLLLSDTTETLVLTLDLLTLITGPFLCPGVRKMVMIATVFCSHYAWVI